MDKTEFGPGPWQDEPDRVEFEHAGFPCMINRGPAGAWCGYVAVPPGHALHGAHYDTPDVRVHGGLTYARACQGEICHVPKPGEPDDVWWFGFDCGHCDDLMPAYTHLFPERLRTGVYRDQAYVTAQTKRLAEQLVEGRARAETD